MNVVATSLRIRERPSVVPERDRRRRPQRPAARDDAAALPAHRRRAGLPVRQRPARQLPGRVLRAERHTVPGAPPGCWSRAFCSALWHGPFVRRLFKRFEGTVRVDGELLDADRVRRPDGRDGPRGRPGLQARPSRRRRSGALRRPGDALGGRCRCRSTCWRCSAGRGIAPQRAFSAVASQMDVHPQERQRWPTRSTATSTGRTSRSRSPLGPPIDFLKPPSALIVRAARRYHGGQR